MIESKGGAAYAESVELRDLAHSGLDGGGVSDPSSSGEGLPFDATGAIVPSAVPSPQPLFVTIADPNTHTAGTFSLPFGKSITITHAGTVTIFEPESQPFPVAQRIAESREPSPDGER